MQQCAHAPMCACNNVRMQQCAHAPVARIDISLFQEKILYETLLLEQNTATCMCITSCVIGHIDDPPRFN